MRTFPTQKEIDAYNSLTDEEIKARRKRHKVYAIKEGLVNIKDDMGDLIKITAQKGFYTLVIGLGAVGTCTGVFTHEIISTILGIIFGSGFIGLGTLFLKNANEFSGIIDELKYIKVHMQGMYYNVKNTNSYYPLHDEEGMFYNRKNTDNSCDKIKGRSR